MIVLVLFFSVCSTFASADNSSNEKPAFEKDGRARRTLNLSEHNGEEFKYYTSGSSKNPNDKVSCTLIGEWVTVFDPEVGYSENMTSFYVPEGIFADSVQFTGGAELFKNIDGYEWRCGRFVISGEKPTYIIFGLCDYVTDVDYDEAPNSNFVLKQKPNNDGYIYGGTFSLGTKAGYDNCFGYLDVTYLQEGKQFLTIANMFFRVPIGYENCVFEILDTRNFSGEKNNGLIDNDTTGLNGASDYYFRMK